MKIITLYERTGPLTAETRLPESIAALYDRGLEFAFWPNGRPLIIGNFVRTLDGIVSFKIPHQSGGGVISGGNEEDRFIMALLRTCADAVMVGTGTLHEDSGHLWTSEFIYPSMADRFVELRTRLRKKSPHPLTVIVSGSGHVNLAEKCSGQPASEYSFSPPHEGRLTVATMRTGAVGNERSSGSTGAGHVTAGGYCVDIDW
jgi:hypothetical protein